MRCTIETKVSSPQRLFLNLIFSFSTPTHSLSSGSSLRSTEREWALTRKTKIRFETDLFLFLSVAYFLFNKKTMTNGDRGKRKSARHPRPKVAHRDSREKLHLRVSVWVSGGNVWSFESVRPTGRKEGRTLTRDSNSEFTCASLKTSNIPFAWFLVLGCNRQAQTNNH